jgi:hypothetical protein
MIAFFFSRTCRNGVVVTEKTVLHHGDRILWGNNHFFRINCPRSPETGLYELLFIKMIRFCVQVNSENFNQGPVYMRPG